jgi:hypothetical protein
MRNALFVFVAVMAVGCSSSSSGSGTVTDSGQGSGTDSETGGGTCSLSSSCLGAFLGTCFDPVGTCTVSGPTGSSVVIFTNGAKMTKSGTTWTATNTKGVDCYTVDDNGGGGFTFHVGSATLTMTTAGNQTRWTCPDGTPDNFTTSAFDNSECGLYVPGASCK